MAINILRFIIPKSLVEYIDTDSTVRQALEKMLFHRYSAIPIVDGDGRYIGTLRNDDILKFFIDSGSSSRYDAEDYLAINIIKEGSSKPLLHSATMEELVDEVKEHNFVPIVDDRGCFIGIILRRDVLNYLLKFYKDE